MTSQLLAQLAIFVISAFLGFELISRVPNLPKSYLVPKARLHLQPGGCRASAPGESIGFDSAL